MILEKLIEKAEIIWRRCFVPRHGGFYFFLSSIRASAAHGNCHLPRWPGLLNLELGRSHVHELKAARLNGPVAFPLPV